MLYLDTSALVKIIVPETESPALRRELAATPPVLRFTSALTRTELVLAVRRRGNEHVAAAMAVLRGLTTVALTTELLDAAGAVPPVGLRSLDAVHLATALELGAELDAVVTYDTRLGEAAQHHGLRVLAPQ